MNFYLLLPVLTGLAIVAQATLNKMSAGVIGFSSTVLVNGVVFLVGSVALWAAVKMGLLPWNLEMDASSFQLSWKVILPGICGLAIVFGTPIALMHLGTSLTFSLVIATQLLLGLIIDIVIDGKPLTWPLVAGSVVMALGCALILNAEKLNN